MTALQYTIKLGKIAASPICTNLRVYMHVSVVYKQVRKIFCYKYLTQKFYITPNVMQQQTLNQTSVIFAFTQLCIKCGLMHASTAQAYYNAPKKQAKVYMHKCCHAHVLSCQNGISLSLPQQLSTLIIHFCNYILDNLCLWLHAFDTYLICGFIIATIIHKLTAVSSPSGLLSFVNTASTTLGTAFLSCLNISALSGDQEVVAKLNSGRQHFVR